MRKLYTLMVAMFVSIAASAADYTLSASCSPSFGDYVVDETYFPAAEIAERLGLADTLALRDLIETNTAFYLVQNDGTRTNEGFSDPNQPWMTAEPRVGAYGAEGTCWFAGIAYAPAEDGTPSVNAWVGDMPGFFKTVYEPTDLSATFYLVNGEKEVSFEFNLHVDAAVEVGPKLLGDLDIVGHYDGTLLFTEGGQYEGKTFELDMTEVVAALGTDMATLETEFASRVFTQKIYHNPESGYDEYTDTLDLPENLSGGSWFGRYSDPEAEELDVKLLQNAPMSWGAGCTYYLQSPALADGKFTLVYGQYPGTLKPGDKDYADLYIVYGNKAARVTLTVDVTALANVPFSEMTQVGLVNIEKSQAPTNDYSPVSFSIDTEAAAEMLGVDVTDLTLNPLKDAENLYAGSSTANNGGWWFNKEGYVCSWGSGVDGSYFFIEPAASGEYSAMNLGQMPDQYQVGDSAVTDLFLVAGAKYVKYHVVLNIVKKEEIETGDLVLAGNRTITIKQEANDGYVWSSQAGIIKADDLYNLIGTVDPVLYGEVADSTGVVTWTDAYTMGEKPGFWLTSEGYAASWGNNTTWGMTSQAGTTGATNGDWGFKCMQFPGSGVVGNSFQGTFYLVNPENSRYIKVTLINKVVETVTEDEVIGEEYLTVPVTMEGADIEFDLAHVAEALGVDVDVLADGNNMHGATGAAVPASTGLQFSENGTIVEDGEGAFGFVFDDINVMYVYSNLETEVADDWSVTTDVYFDVEGKQYIVHITFVSNAIYTGISDVKTSTAKTSIYDLQGRQVSKAIKGVYIQNGRKFVK